MQRGPVHLGAGVSADAGSQQDVCSGVMTMLSGQVEGGRPQLQDTQVTQTDMTLYSPRIHLVNTAINFFSIFYGESEARVTGWSRRSQSEAEVGGHSQDEVGGQRLQSEAEVGVLPSRW